LLLLNNKIWDGRGPCEYVPRERRAHGESNRQVTAEPIGHRPIGIRRRKLHPVPHARRLPAPARAARHMPTPSSPRATHLIHTRTLDNCVRPPLRPLSPGTHLSEQARSLASTASGPHRLSIYKLASPAAATSHIHPFITHRVLQLLRIHRYN
jgi:hypothetical protein